ncbi:CheY-like superfamily, partial [Ochromonadaceae sp. CCMP2298]
MGTNEPPCAPPAPPAPPDTSSTAETFLLANTCTCTARRSGSLRLEVRDTGRGMTAAQIDRLFKGPCRDLGLGLHTARHRVHQHSGTMTVSSEGPGRGSAFTVLLPLYHLEGVHLAPVAPTPVAPCRSSKKLVALAALLGETFEIGEGEGAGGAGAGAGGTGGAGGSGGVESDALHVLVVDDVPSCRKMLVRLLRRKKAHCEEARDGQEAVEMVKTSYAKGRPYDVVLMDYEMPAMNGPAATKQLRALGLTVLVIGVTGNRQAEDLVHFKDCGANAVLPKPLKMASLQQTLQ